jgi:hypothetical protein
LNSAPPLARGLAVGRCGSLAGSSMIVFFVAIFLTAVLCVTSAIAVMLALHTTHIRHALASPARPLLVATAAEQIPPDLAEFLAQAVPALNKLGFAAVASVHAPQMVASITWTQVLFLRRDRGDRASVMLLRPMNSTARALAASPPALMFATELADGRSVKTGTRHAISSPTAHDDIGTLYAKHRGDVDQQLGGDAIGLMPGPGEEIAWLQARAGAIAGVLAEMCGFSAAADGESFRPPWRLAVRAAWKELWARRSRPRTHGFEITPSVPALTPPSALPPNSR